MVSILPMPDALGPSLESDLAPFLEVRPAPGWPGLSKAQTDQVLWSICVCQDFQEFLQSDYVKEVFELTSESVGEPYTDTGIVAAQVQPETFWSNCEAPAAR